MPLAAPESIATETRKTIFFSDGVNFHMPAKNLVFEDSSRNVELSKMPLIDETPTDDLRLNGFKFGAEILSAKNKSRTRPSGRVRT